MTTHGLIQICSRRNALPWCCSKLGRHTSVGKQAVRLKGLLLSNDGIALIKVHTYIVPFDTVYFERFQTSIRQKVIIFCICYRSMCISRI